MKHPRRNRFDRTTHIITMKPIFLTTVICVLNSLGSLRAAETAPPARPNVILILSDDQGFTDYGFMGHPIVKTPNLDRLASQSLLYTRGYVMPVCSPALACLLTGQLPHIHGITGNDLSLPAIKTEEAKGKNDRSPLSHQLLSNSVIPPRALTKAGYLTFQTGKLWNVTAQEVGFTAGMTSVEGRHGGDGLDIGRKTMKPMFDFMEKAVSEQKPFFVWYAPMMPHEPHNPPNEFLGHPEQSLVTRVIINGWSKLLLPGPVRPDKAFTSAPKAPALFDLKSDPLEKHDLAAERPAGVSRLEALQNAA